MEWLIERAFTVALSRGCPYWSDYLAAGQFVLHVKMSIQNAYFGWVKRSTLWPWDCAESLKQWQTLMYLMDVTHQGLDCAIRKYSFLGSFLSRVRRYSIENSLIILTPENRTCDMCAQRLPNTGWCHVVSTLRRFVLALFPIGWISPWLIIKSSCFGTIETTHSLT